MIPGGTDDDSGEVTISVSDSEPGYSIPTRSLRDEKLTDLRNEDRSGSNENDVSPEERCDR
jgi:hypothetical protein